ncbi:hypothetical protein [Mucilaginibacter sp. UYCu711]|uniref:hypothetical protein n=1 Tax=Mucilaginibacter sp. UYCu711 TaxID=3156339 RepID=UPI003D1B413E
MTNRLRELSDNELQLSASSVFNYAHADSVTDQTSTPALFEDYKAIHNAYLNLYKESRDAAIKTEALKRLIFLNWYYLAEPNLLTGISELHDDTMLEAYELLNGLLQADELDDEFKWMLAFYSKWDYTIFQFSEDGLDELTAFVKENRWVVRQPPAKELIEGKMDNRGQMGKYLTELSETIL